LIFRSFCFNDERKLKCDKINLPMSNKFVQQLFLVSAANAMNAKTTPD
jgi:hypothetical protein